MVLIREVGVIEEWIVIREMGVIAEWVLIRGHTLCYTVLFI